MNHLHTRQKGKIVEELVAKYLEKKGYKILVQNAYISHGEIDIICKDEEYIVFVEVKSSFTKDYDIYSALTKKKKRLLKLSINNYLAKYSMQNRIWRFDYVAVKKISGLFEIEHFTHVSLE